ncbi:MAG: hypothetical protein F6J93_07360 [Oscillatoria sp. SIO1A7]|nr:hypothetical protein [Oscillatoria sp. SIO1A7]
MSTPSRKFFSAEPIMAFSRSLDGEKIKDGKFVVLWIAIAVIGGFALYQGTILLAFPLLADSLSAAS